ncbi:unnamed protein product [Phytomonas sp. EM1]|nr:unnamed protein product [Phytomonas sp. EM1]|eukprot:CCW63095.1 unnamed protein product [Phytomonas sp. isolate EM1]
MKEYRVVKIRPLCLWIRFAPLGVLVAVHCSGGHWPTNDECLQRALEYGFSTHNFSKKWQCLWTHIFVHFTNEHFFANSLALSYALLEFGDENVTEAIQEESLWISFKSAIGSSLVMLVAGPVGGIGGQMCYNKLQSGRVCEKAAGMIKDKITLIYHLFARTMRSIGFCSHASGAFGSGDEVVSRTISASLERVGTFCRGCFYSGTAGIQKIVNRSMVMCGASAAVCGLAGFNAVFFHNPLCMIFLVLPDALLLLQNAVSHAFASGWEKHVDMWKSLMPRQTVGHAAHLGGFIVGASIGWALRRILGRKSRASRTSETPRVRTVYLFTI